MDRKTIKYLLDIANITQRGIAQQCGVTPATVSYTISGRRFTRSVQEAVAAALGRKIEDIFPDGGKDKKRGDPSHNRRTA